LNSNEIHDLPLRLNVRFDVALGGAERCMTGQNLNVPDRAADCRNLSRGVCDEGSPARVTGTAVEADLAVPARKQAGDCGGGGLL
jgi:hypothetical protein